MSVKTRIILLVLNALCIPLNLYNIIHNGSYLAALALVWCAVIVVSYSAKLLEIRKQNGKLWG